MAIQDCAENGQFDPRKIVALLQTSSGELARTLGLAKDALGREDLMSSDHTQHCIAQMAEVLGKIEARFGSTLVAYAWYRSEPIPGFSGQSAMELVQSGRARDVLAYIEAVSAGIHA